MIPPELKEDYEPLLHQQPTEEHRVVKAADKLCAYLKCVEELKGGNSEFAQAKDSIYRDLMGIDLPEIGWFMAKFEPSFHLTLDELK